MSTSCLLCSPSSTTQDPGNIRSEGIKEGTKGIIWLKRIIFSILPKHKQRVEINVHPEITILYLHKDLEQGVMRVVEWLTIYLFILVYKEVTLAFVLACKHFEVLSQSCLIIKLKFSYGDELNNGIVTKRSKSSTKLSRRWNFMVFSTRSQFGQNKFQTVF